MKKISKYLGTFLLTFTLLLGFFASNGQTVSIQSDQTSLIPGDIVVVPITVSATFESTGFYISYDRDVLIPASPFITAVDPRFQSPTTNPNYNTSINPSGIVYIGAFTPDGVNVTMTGEIIFSLRFIYNGGSSTLHFRRAPDPTPSPSPLSKLFNDWGDEVPVTWTDATMSGTGFLTVKSAPTGSGLLWKNASTWRLEDGVTAVPTGFIPTGNTNTIITGSRVAIDATARSRDLTINPAGSLTVNPAIPLAVTGNMLIESSAASTGSFLNNGTLTVAGTSSAQRWVTANWTSGLPNASTIWHYVSSPVSGSTIATFMGCLLNKWNESLERWDTLTLPTTIPLVPGVGYSLAKATPDGIVTFTGGSFNNEASYNPTITYNSGSFAGWNLIGNPYPCAISWDLITPKTNVAGAVYTWNGTTKNYVSYSGGAGSLTNGTIPAEQAFFVQATGANPSITIPSSARLHSTIGLYKNTVDNVLTMNVKGNDAAEDFTYIHITPEATNGIDQDFDAYKLFGMEDAPQLYSITPSAILSINSLPEIPSQSSISLGFKAGLAGTYTFTATDVETFSTGTALFLEDILTNVIQNLRTNPVYSFSAAPGQAEHRFNLHFSAVGMPEGKTANVKIYASEQTVYVNFPSEFSGTIIVYNMLGSEITRTAIQPQAINKINLNVPSGFYLVKVDSDTFTTASKVFIK